MKKRFMAVMLSAIMLVAMAASASFAATEYVKMTTYRVLKSGNTVYCPSADYGIYKVTVKNGKVRKVKWLTKTESAMGAFSFIGALKKKGNNLYYLAGSEGTYSTLNRINLNTGKSKLIAVNATGYAFKDGKLYAEIYKDTGYGDCYTYRSMKLNGNSKKKTSIRPKVKYKTSNVKGYSVSYKEKGGYVYTYLKTPKGKYKLGKIKLEYY